jgi:hypothetical protein
MKTPAYRYLQGYTLDPGFSTLLDTFLINETVYRIRWERTKPGPVGEYFEVVDYDPASRCFYEPVDLHDESVLASGGLDPSEGNAKFHQQFVYTISMKTLERFEEALGRKVIWHRRQVDETTFEYVPRIRIYPHGLREANAYYNPEKRALLFGYFKAVGNVNGVNFPGGTVFTCLSPDIVAHEVTHAILESIHPRFNENTNRDVPAFHEAFADIIALLQRFMISELLEHQMTAARGRLDESTLMGELATQFGNSLGHSALRSAIGSLNRETGKWERLRPNPEDYQAITEPHHRGAILVATFFDAFLRVYNFKTRDLFQLAGDNQSSPLLIKRLAQEATMIARHLMQIAIQALDYCPPFDISFGDYLRALITADIDMAPSDESGFRIALIEAFRARGIFPGRVNTLSVESLRWGNENNFTKEESEFMKRIRDVLRSNVRALLDVKDREKLYAISQKICGKLHGILIDFHGEIKSNRNASPDAWPSFLKKLGLTSAAPVFNYDGRIYLSKNEIKTEVHHVRPAFRYTREGRHIEQVIVTLTQKMIMTSQEGDEVVFRGGCSIIFNMNTDYAIEYIIVKNINSERRFKAQMEYQLGNTTSELPLTDTMYGLESSHNNLSFKALHSH